MRDISEVIREKEAQLTRINEELAALRLALRLLTDETGDTASSMRSNPREESRGTTGKVKSFP